MTGKKGSEVLTLKGKEQKRIEAMNVAQGIMRVVSCPEAFGYVLEAVESKNKDLLEAACKAAFVPDDMAKYLRKIVFDGSVYAQKPRSDQAFCW